MRRVAAMFEINYCTVFVHLMFMTRHFNYDKMKLHYIIVVHYTLQYSGPSDTLHTIYKECPEEPHTHLNTNRDTTLIF